MEILTILNEWWDNSKISKDKAKDYKRKIFDEVKKTFFNYRQILILNGLRRVGKSTIIYQLIDELLNNKVNSKNIVYFSFDEVIEDPIKILEEYSKITKIEWRKEKIFVFFDEIQKLKNWTSKTKILYDNFPNLKICISGSASLMIEKTAIKDLAGRYFSLYVEPLSLKEFAELYFEKEINNFRLYELDLKRIFEAYISKPFPEIVKWEDKIRINQYIKQLVVEKIIKSDIPESFKNVNASLLSTLTEIFMKDVGMTLDITSLSRELGVHKLTLSEHINFLEFGNIIRIVKNFRPSIRSESRKLKKVYPFNIALSLCFYPKLTERKILECITASSLNLNKYWRKNEKEIDFLKIDKSVLPIEVKEKENINKKDIKTMIYFMKKYNLNDGLIIYYGKKEDFKVGNKKIIFLPIYELVFNLGV